MRKMVEIGEEGMENTHERALEKQSVTSNKG